MGTAASHSSEEEEEGAEEGMEGAAGAPQPGAAAPALPPAEVLLEQARLREATARLREAALPEPLVSRHHSALVRWLEERLSRGDEAVSLEQFCEVLESVSRLAAGSRGESEEVRAGRKRRPQGSGITRAGRNLGDSSFHPHLPVERVAQSAVQLALDARRDGGPVPGSACPARGCWHRGRAAVLLGLGLGLWPRGRGHPHHPGDPGHTPCCMGRARPEGSVQVWKNSCCC